MKTERPLKKLGLLSSVIYLSFYCVDPLRRKFNDEDLVLSDPYIYVALIAVLLLLFLLYIVGYKILLEADVKKRTIVLYFIFFNFILFPIVPIGSGDLFSYISQARVYSQWGENPYLVPYDNLVSDELSFPKTVWTSWVSVYGPVFVRISSCLSFLGGDSFLLTFVLFKGFFIFVSMANLLLLDAMFRNRLVVYLYAWHPLTIYEFAVNAHMSVLFVFFVFLSAYILKRSRLLLLSHGSLVLASMVKFTGFLFLPMTFLIVLFQRGEKQRLMKTISLITLTAGMTVFFWYPFWEGTRTLAGFFRASSLYNFNAVGTNILSAIFYVAGVQNFLLKSHYAAKAIFLIVYAAVLLRVAIGLAKGREFDVFNVFIWLYGGFLLAMSYIMPWYFFEFFLLLLIPAGEELKKKKHLGRYEHALIFVSLYSIVLYSL